MILCCFPYVFPNPIILTGIQPYAILFSALVLAWYIICGGRMWTDDPLMVAIAIGTAITVFIAILSLINAPVTTIARELCAYLNIFLVPAAFCVLNENGNYNLERLYKVCILIWLAVGLMQTFINKAMFSQILYHTNTSADRGVFGLATEPSFYGIQLYFFLYLVKGFKKHKIQYYVALVVWAVFIVKSATALLFIGGFLAADFFDGKETVKKLLFLGILLIGLAMVLEPLLSVLKGSRLLYLIGQVLDEGLAALASDQSAFGRIARITDSVGQALSAGLVPQGIIVKFGSAWGGALNHLGLFGFIYVFAVPAFISRFYLTSPGKAAGYLSVLLLFFTTVQLSNPTIGLLIGESCIKRKILNSCSVMHSSRGPTLSLLSVENDEK